MEDSVGEEERREQGETMAQAKAHQEEVAAADVGRGGGEPAQEQDGGFLSAMASKVGSTMSGTNGSGGEANATAASDGEAGNKRDGDGEPNEEGGFLSSMASKIGAAMSSANGGTGSDGGGNEAVATYDDAKEKDDGDGGGGIFHKLLSSSPPASSPASVEAEEEKGQNGAGEQAGILSAMASKIGMSMSQANGHGNHSTEEESKTSSTSHAVDASNCGEKAAETNGGGILNTMASKIGMAMSGANGDEDHGGDTKKGNGDAVDVSKDEEKRDETNGGGGILSAVASKIGMTVSGANGNGKHSTEDDGKTNNGDATDHSKGEEKEKGHDANGAGIVEQIISNLPSDDQALDSEEASLLIAIIED